MLRSACRHSTKFHRFPSNNSTDHAIQLAERVNCPLITPYIEQAHLPFYDTKVNLRTMPNHMHFYPGMDERIRAYNRTIYYTANHILLVM